MNTIISKEPFHFSYTQLTLDWYTTINAEIKWEDYAYFKLEYRYGRTYWIIGYKATETSKYSSVQLGEIYLNELGRFIDWCVYTHDLYTINKLVGIEVISSSMNILDVVNDIHKSYSVYKSKVNSIN